MAVIEIQTLISTQPAAFTANSLTEADPLVKTDIPKMRHKMNREQFVEAMSEQYELSIILAGQAKRVTKKLRPLDLQNLDKNNSNTLDTKEEFSSLFDLLLENLKLKNTDELVLTKGEHSNALTQAGKIFEALTYLLDRKDRPKVGQVGYDPFEPHEIIQDGPYQGEKIDTRMKRSFRLLSAEEAQPYGGKPNETIIANVWHDNKFWVVRIPEDAVEDVMIQSEKFGKNPVVAHLQTRFRLKEGKEAIFVPQVYGDPAKPIAMRDLIATPEATGTRAYHFNVLLGLFKQFAVAYRMESIHTTRKDLDNEKHQLPQSLVKATNKQKQDLLMNYILMASIRNMQYIYHSLGRSCATETIRNLDVIFKGVYDLFAKHIGIHLYRIPVLLDWYLKLRDINSTDREWVPLEKEKLLPITEVTDCRAKELVFPETPENNVASS